MSGEYSRWIRTSQPTYKSFHLVIKATCGLALSCWKMAHFLLTNSRHFSTSAIFSWPNWELSLLKYLISPCLQHGQTHGRDLEGKANWSLRKPTNANMSSIREGFPRWLSEKESTCQCRRLRLNPWVGKIPWRRTWLPTPAFLPGKSHGQRGAWWGTVHGVTKNSDTA